MTRSFNLKCLISERFQSVWPSPRTPARAFGNVRMLLANCCADAVTNPAAGIEPPVGGPLAAGERNVVQVAVENDVAEAERRAALISEDIVHLPAAGDASSALGNVEPSMPAAPERQFHDALNVEAVRTVEAAIERFTAASPAFRKLVASMFFENV